MILNKVVKLFNLSWNANPGWIGMIYKIHKVDEQDFQIYWVDEADFQICRVDVHFSMY